MAFDDLEDATEDQDEGGSSQSETESEPAESESSQTQSMSESQADTATSDSDTVSDQPAFEFSETTQDALYARPDAWDEFEDLLDLDLERELRDRGIRNVAKSEKCDAALRVLTELSEEIADQIERARRERDQ